MEQADPNLFGAPDERPRLAVERTPLLRKVKRTLGVGSSRDRVREWLTKVDPGTSGPVAPEEGWAIEWAVKADAQAPEGHDSLVVFDVQSYRFEYGSWRACDTSPAGKPQVLVPREFAASLPMEALAEAWNDFEAEVAEHNAQFWAAQQARRDGVSQEQRERAAAYETERGTSELLG